MKMNFADLPATPVGPVSETMYYAEIERYPRWGYSYMLLEGRVDTEALSQAVRRIQYAYPNLISRLELRRKGMKHQLWRVPMAEPPPLRIVDDFASDPGDRSYRDALMDFFEPMYVKVTDLFAEAPFLFYLVRFPGDRSALVFYCHHISSDAGSTFALIRDLFATYHELVTGRSPAWAQIMDMASGSRVVERYSTLRVLREMRRESMLLKKHPVVRFGREVHFTSPARHVVGFTFSEEETQALAKRAKALGVTVNDLVSVSVIRLLDEEMGNPEGTLSFWMPANVRSGREDSRRANYATAINVNLIREERCDSRRLLETFKAKRKAMFASGRPFVNLRLLRKLLGFMHLFPLEIRTPWMLKILSRPMTFMFSNAGILWPKRVDGKLTPYSAITEAGGLNLVDYGYNVSTSHRLGQGLVAHTFNGRFGTFYSVNKQLMSREEGQRLMDKLREALLAGC